MDFITFAKTKEAEFVKEEFSKIILELNDASKYSNLFGEQFEQEVKSDIKAAIKLKEFINKIIKLSQEQKKVNKNLI